MPTRPFAGPQTCTGNPQPAFGTTTTAVVNPTYDQFAGNVTGANPSMTTLAVTSTLGFRTGDYVLVCAQYPVGGPPNMGQVKTIASSTSMTVQGLTQSVASGSFVLLSAPCEALVIQNLTAATLYYGTASTVSSTDSSLLGELFATGVFSSQTTALSHGQNTCEWWINGTAAGTFISSYQQG